MSATPHVTAPASADVAELDDQELLAAVRSQPRGSRSREAACEELTGRYQSLVRACAMRYRDSPEPIEELMQVGYVGLLKAINNFDPTIGESLAAYARPCVSGEIKRHFRDTRWHIRVSRTVQELRLQIRRSETELTQQLSREPTDDELAEHLCVNAGELLEAQRAGLAFHALSLNAPPGDDADAGTLDEVLGQEDPLIETALDTQTVWAHLGELPDREQRLLVMRFYGNMTQAEIGRHLGISQMHVSRLLSHALRYLRERILDSERLR